MNRRIFTSAIVSLLIPILSMAGCAPSYSNPKQPLQGMDLAGVWETKYGKNEVDRITIREDGTFKQTYQDSQTDYKFETPWNSWWLEYLPDGNMYIHLEGGRNYSAGIRKAELDGMMEPCPTEQPNCGRNNLARAFWDPYTGKGVEMPGELLLTVRVDSSGNLIFHHMSTSPDGGFAIIGGEADIFRRIESDNSES